MAIKKSYKLSRATQHPKGPFLSQGSLLDQTKLNRFIAIAFFLHASVILLQSIVVAPPKDPFKTPPIKIKYIDPQKNVKQSKSIVKTDKITEEKKQKLKPKKYHEKKLVAQKFSKTPRANQRKQTLENFKSLPARLKYKTNKEMTASKLLKKKNLATKRDNSNDSSLKEKKLLGEGILSTLNDFDVKKYALLDKQVSEQDASGDEEPISLDTKEAKYVSYFNRIKHQIQRAWIYPAQASQKGISGQLTLKFEISRDGNLIGVQLVDNSGSEILDIGAIKAVKEAAPYYPFPMTISKKKISILATFVYSPPHKQSKM